jgi:hypothetical protein
MALASTLPIYRVTYELLQVVTRITKDMPRDYKQSLGNKIREECVELTVLIYRANCSREKRPHIEALQEHLQVATLLIRLSKDMRLISTGQFAQTIQLTDQIGRQASGWFKSASSPAA